MNFTDKRLYAAANWEDFRFRLGYDEEVYNRRSAFQNIVAGPLTMPDPSQVWGVDTSHWDGNVDFNVTKVRGGAFAIIKCQDGTIETRYWRANRSAAMSAGLIVGDYMWLYPDHVISCKSQASALWSRIKDMEKQIPVTIDFEWTTYAGKQANPTYDDLNKFVTAFTGLSGYKPMLYSAAGYMNSQGRIPESLKDKFCAFWFANYGVQKPMLPYGFFSWDFWQFSASGNAAVLAPNNSGKKEVDLNYWNGTLAELQAFANVKPEEPPAKKVRLTILIDGEYTITEEIL